MARNVNFDRPWYKTAYELFRQGVNGNSGLKVLDIGGGSSEFAQTLQRDGCVVDLVDIDPDNVERSRQLGFHAVQHDCNLPLTDVLPPESYDAVVMLESIEHVFNTDVLLSGVYALLKPNGFVVITTPNVSHIWWRFRMLAGQPPKGDGYHLRFFTYRTLTGELQQKKFRIEQEDHSTSTFGLNYIRYRLGLPPLHLPLPRFLRGLLIRNFYLVARK